MLFGDADGRADVGHARNVDDREGTLIDAQVPRLADRLPPVVGWPDHVSGNLVTKIFQYGIKQGSHLRLISKESRPSRHGNQLRSWTRPQTHRVERFAYVVGVRAAGANPGVLRRRSRGAPQPPSRTRHRFPAPGS
jgi:hypothetical protein